MAKNALNKQAALYNDMKREPSYIRSVWSAIRPFVRGRVLDIGGNDGALLDNYTAGEKYVLDVAEDALEKARRKGYRAVKRDMHRTGFESAFFDTVLLIHAFEHSPQPFRLLSEIRRIAKKDATIIIECPNARSIRQILNLISGNPLPAGNSPVFFDAPNHYFQYTSKTLYETLKKGGFKSIRLFGKPPVAQPLNFLFKLLPEKVGAAISTDIIAVANP